MGTGIARLERRDRAPLCVQVEDYQAIRFFVGCVPTRQPDLVRTIARGGRKVASAPVSLRARPRVVQLLKALRHAPDRLLHAKRRRAALASLRNHRPPATVLVVCNGNIFRSPFAAALLRSALGPHGVRVNSAGFVAPGRPTPPDALAAAAARGIDLSTHRSQLTTSQLVRAADLIVVMDSAQRRAICERFGGHPREVLILGDLDPEAIESRGIEDPVQQLAEVCARVYARIERCGRELVQAVSYHFRGRQG